MLRPVKTTASWLGGRFLLFTIILVALVVLDAYREESLLLGALGKGLVPDRELVDRLERDLDDLEKFARSAEQAVNDRLRRWQQQTDGNIEDRIAVLESEIEARESNRLAEWRKAVAVVTGEGLKEDLENELQLQLGRAERDALQRLQGEMASIRRALADAKQREQFARREHRSKCAGYTAAKASRESYIENHPIRTRVRGTGAWDQRQGIDDIVRRWSQDCVRAFEEYQVALSKSAEAARAPTAYLRHIESANDLTLKPLEDLVDAKKSAVATVDRETRKILQSVRRVFFWAFSLVVLVTLAPVGIKAFWYYVFGPYAQRSPAIRLADRPGDAAVRATSAAPETGSMEKISAVSQEVMIDEREELLVHPEFLQRSANQGRKVTKWLLSWKYPLTSIAAGMAVLDRFRVPRPDSFVISSKTDPFAEVGIIQLAAGEKFVLQPRHLVGLVQLVERPIRIHRQWRFNWQAVITLQFRYLIFEGPGRLIVQGCRGVRLEYAGGGRSIDQGATIGFSANLDYSPRRSETFSAYLLGTRALFNDTFAGGPGFYVYEEMPYAGKRSGITGRGLEGLTDGLLKVVGI